MSRAAAFSPQQRHCAKEPIARAQNGTSTQRITYRRYANEFVTVSESDSETVIPLVNKAYITMNGINIRSTDCTGVFYARLDNNNNTWIGSDAFEHPGANQGDEDFK